MNYLIQVLWILSWPLLIFIAYKVILWLLQNYEKKLEEESE
jgi:hypothetical protein